MDQDHDIAYDVTCLIEHVYKTTVTCIRLKELISVEQGTRQTHHQMGHLSFILLPQN